VFTSLFRTVCLDFSEVLSCFLSVVTT
jgi:hypothetical protein